MRVKSLSTTTDQEYYVCQIKSNTESLHAQSTEAIPGWESRPYGSAFTHDLASAISQIIKDEVNKCYFTKSLYDGGATYIIAQVRELADNAYEFQILKRDGSFIAFQV